MNFQSSGVEFMICIGNMLQEPHHAKGCLTYLPKTNNKTMVRSPVSSGFTFACSAHFFRRDFADAPSLFKCTFITFFAFHNSYIYHRIIALINRNRFADKIIVFFKNIELTEFTCITDRMYPNCDRTYPQEH